VIICPLFHRINDTYYSNSLDSFRDSLAFLVENYNIVVPGGRISKEKLNVCITFDDAYYDFYYYVFPLLKEFKARVLLAVPVKYILEDTTIQAETRLDVHHSQAMVGEIYKDKAPFCTWAEIREMVNSGLIETASHSYSHQVIRGGGNTDLSLEVVKSKEILEKKLEKKIRVFVYPFGAFDRAAHKLVMQHYVYSMRIGNALNLSWENRGRLIYRANADGIRHISQLLTKRRLTKYFFKFLSNAIRGK
jgi:peptidoglycan/xylan/chitin deacetylase (PgdA/CDA1 family)